MVLATDGIDSGFAAAIDHAAGGPGARRSDPRRARQGRRRRARRRRALPAPADDARAGRSARGDGARRRRRPRARRASSREACGLTAVEAQHVATAVSEVASNAVKYAGGRRGRARRRPSARAAAACAVDGARRGPGHRRRAAALRDGVSTGGSLGLGLPGARRLMDDFALDSGPGGTVVTMARWAGGPPAGARPCASRSTTGAGGVALAQPFRNGLLLGIAAGPRADEVVRLWRTRPWHAPAQLAEAARGGARPGRAARARAGERQRARRAAGVAARGRGRRRLLRGGRVAARAPGGHEQYVLFLSRFLVQLRIPPDAWSHCCH